MAAIIRDAGFLGDFKLDKMSAASVAKARERRTDPADGFHYSLEDMRGKYEGIYNEDELLAYFYESCLEQHGSPSGSDSAEWVFVEEPTQEELRLVPYSSAKDSLVTPAAATGAMVSGVAGLLIMGPVAGAVIAAGAVGYCAESAEPGALKTAARDAVRWARDTSVPTSRSECEKAAEVLAGRAKEVLEEVRKMPETLGPSLSSVYSQLSGSALGERDAVIHRLQKDLEDSIRDSAEERAHISELQDVEKHWRETSERLTSQLEIAEKANAEEQHRLNEDLEAAKLAKAEEVDRLAKELRATERVWESDTARLNRELESHRRERMAETKRLTSELADAAAAREAELNKLRSDLEESEHRQAAEVQATEQAKDALEAVKRQIEEENDAKRCSVCLEEDRQILFLPCRHVCCCRNCASSLTKCPICRGTIAQQIDMIMA